MDKLSKQVTWAVEIDDVIDMHHYEYELKIEENKHEQNNESIDRLTGELDEKKKCIRHSLNI